MRFPFIVSIAIGVGSSVFKVLDDVFRVFGFGFGRFRLSVGVVILVFDGLLQFFDVINCGFELFHHTIYYLALLILVAFC